MNIKKLKKKVDDGLGVSAVWEAGELFIVNSSGGVLYNAVVDWDTALDICEQIHPNLELTEV
jgi:hypothetical protein